MGQSENFPAVARELSLDTLPTSLSDYLTDLGLPTENVLVPFDEREAVRNNMPAIMSRLGDRASDAVYVSKFIVAAAVGLFDAALNYLWNETIDNLRRKVERFDLQYFYDTAIQPQDRSRFKDAADLVKIEDWVLIVGCRDTGIISDIGFRHLDHIRDMRNWASAAHPNQNELTGLQLAAWLDTCVKEVINKEPEASVIEVRRLLRNIREQIFDDASVAAIVSAVDALPAERVSTLFNSIFGMFIDDRLDSAVRNNITRLSAAVWQLTADEDRYQVGLKYETLTSNGDAARGQLARDFLESVDGLGYLSGASLAAEMVPAITALYSAHAGFDNFYNEEAPALRLSKLIPASGTVPVAVRSEYVRVVTLAAVGNRYGIAWLANPHYSEMIAKWGNEEARSFVRLPLKAEIAGRISTEACAGRFKDIAERLSKQVTSRTVRDALDLIARVPDDGLSNVAQRAAYRDVLSRL